MKRIIRILAAFLFCLAIAMPAMAAEPKEYVFEVMPSISLLDTFDFSFSSDVDSFMYEGFLPEGLYDVYIYTDDTLIASSQKPVFVSYFLTEINEEGLEANFSQSLLVFDNNDVYDLFVVDLTEFGFTLMGLDGYDDSSAISNYTTVKLVPVENEGQSSSEVIDLIHADLFGSFLICGTIVGLALFRGNRYV